MAPKVKKVTSRAIQLVHNAGCPTTMEAWDPKKKETVEVSAVESYAATRPRTDDRPARIVKVTRCRRCGTHIVTRPDAEITEVVPEVYDDEEDLNGTEGEDEGDEAGAGGS